MDFKKQIEKIINYLKGVKTEMKRINWLTREKTIEYTVIVVIITLIVAAFLGSLDFILTRIMSKFILPH